MDIWGKKGFWICTSRERFQLIFQEENSNNSNSELFQILPWKVTFSAWASVEWGWPCIQHSGSGSTQSYRGSCVCAVSTTCCNVECLLVPDEAPFCNTPPPHISKQKDKMGEVLQGPHAHSLKFKDKSKTNSYPARCRAADYPKEGRKDPHGPNFPGCSGCVVTLVIWESIGSL